MLDNIIVSDSTVVTVFTAIGEHARVLHQMPLELSFSVGNAAAVRADEFNLLVLKHVLPVLQRVFGGEAALVTVVLAWLKVPYLKFAIIDRTGDGFGFVSKMSRTRITVDKRQMERSRIEVAFEADIFVFLGTLPSTLFQIPKRNSVNTFAFYTRSNGHHRLSLRTLIQKGLRFLSIWSSCSIGVGLFG